MKRNSVQQELVYDTYKFGFGEAVATTFLGALIVMFFAIIFYRSIVAVIFLSPIGIYVWKNEQKKKIIKRKKDLSIQFKDCIGSVGANLRAGYSVENAFKESLKDIALLYGDNSYMAVELKYIIHGIRNNVSLEELLLSLGKRSGITDIREFGEVFSIAKRNGGNMSEILVRTGSVISKKMEMDREIQILISAKKMEQHIMNMVPFVIIIYISCTSPGFFDVLYHNVLGVCIMTICLLVYLAAYVLAAKIINICAD